MKRRVVDAVLLRADLAHREADDHAMEVWREAMPVGRHVEWKFFDYVRSGEVVCVPGFQFENAGVRVRSDSSGKTVHVYAASIIAYMREMRAT